MFKSFQQGGYDERLYRVASESVCVYMLYLSSNVFIFDNCACCKIVK